MIASYPFQCMTVAWMQEVWGANEPIGPQAGNDSSEELSCIMSPSK